MSEILMEGKKNKSVSQINASLDTIFAVSGLIADSFLGKKRDQVRTDFSLLIEL